MKRDSGSARLSLPMLFFGIAALVLRRNLYAAAVDVKGLLLRNHPLEIALLVLTAFAVIWILLAVRKLEPSGNYDRTEKCDLLGALGHVAAGAGILLTSLTADLMTGGNLAYAWQLLGLAAPACLLLAGIARLLGKKPFFLLHVVVCLFFVVHIVAHYQLWSSNPQMQDYVFSLLGAMALMFFGFYTASMEADCGNRRMRVAMGLAALYFCTAELARSACPTLYLGGILWVLTDLGPMTAARRKET